MYKRKHGHTNVKYTDGFIGRWVMTQRANYNLKLQGKRSALTDERVKALEELGFVWSIPRRSKDQSRWNRNLEGENQKFCYFWRQFFF